MTRRVTALAAALLLWLLASAPVLAQAPDVRRELLTFERSLDSLADSSAVRRLERESRPRAGADSGVVLQRVLALLRLHQLGDPWAAREAIKAARGVTRSHSDWPAAWYLLGQSLLAKGERQAADPLAVGRRPGLGSFEDASDALSRAASVEPTYLPAVVLLPRAVDLSRDTARLSSQLLPALRAAAEAGVTDPAFLYYLGRVERTIGSLERARSAFRAYLAGGGNRGVGLRQLSWTCFNLGDTSAAVLYYQGAIEDDPASVAGYRGDLTLIGSIIELAGFDSTLGADRVAWLRRFWTDRDRRALRSPGERLAEHYRRLTLAGRWYTRDVSRQLDSYELRSWMLSRTPTQGSQFEIFYDSALAIRDSLQETGGGVEDVPSWAVTGYYERAHSYRVVPDSTPFDERGRVYIRQGEPDSVVRTIAWGVHANETWFYRNPEGDLMLHFGNVPGDYRLLPSIELVETEAWGGEASPGREFLLYDRCNLWSGYCKMLVTRSPNAQRKLRLMEEEIVARSNALATGTDSHALRFARPLAFEASAFAVGRSETSGLVHITWRFRPGAAAGAARGDAIMLPIRVRAVLLDTLGHAVSWGDTTLKVHVLAGDRSVTQVGRVAVVAPPGAYTWTVALSVNDTAGGFVPHGKVKIPVVEVGRVELSDLLLAARGEGAGWAVPSGDTAYVTPRSSWYPDEALTLYHEIYGLVEGERYTASLSVKRGKRGKRTEMSASGTGVAAAGVTRVHRTLSLASLSPGEYLLEIAVKGEKGAWARSSRAITVVKRR